MKKFTASRMAEGAHVFPPEIILDSSGLTVRIPGLFNDREEYFDYDNITNVTVNTPFVGYSTITFHAAGARVAAHGFSKDEVLQIQKAIKEKSYGDSHNDSPSYFT